MKAQNILPDNWEDIVRATLFCCPTLCKNLITDETDAAKKASMLNFAIAIQLAKAPQSGHDRVSEFFQSIRSELS